MKALTLWQPYASAIAVGLKKYETRSWKTSYRGPLVIHASVKPLTKEYKLLANQYDIPIVYGKIVAIAELTDCQIMTQELIDIQSQVEINLGDWRVGRYAWKLKNIRLLKPHTKIAGHQGLWNISPDLCVISERNQCLSIGDCHI